MASAVSRVLQDDIGRVFMQPAVQRLLTALTGFDIKRVYNSRRTGATRRINIRLMTESELKKATEESSRRAQQKLQMPPVLPPRKQVTRTLSHDPGIAGLDTAKLVFTDISPVASNRTREVVVREPSGTLRSATWDETDRINQIYFPIHGRKLRVPKIFDPENLESLLLHGKAYEYVLDSACVQFEPDDPLYLKVVHATYDHCDKHSAYDHLHGTRHFGGLAFYLACCRRIDRLLEQTAFFRGLADAADLVRLYCAIWPGCNTSRAIGGGCSSGSGSSTETLEASSDTHMAVMKAYIASGDVNADFVRRLKMAMQAMEDSSSRQCAGIRISDQAAGDHTATSVSSAEETPLAAK